MPGPWEAYQTQQPQQSPPTTEPRKLDWFNQRLQDFADFTTGLTNMGAQGLTLGGHDELVGLMQGGVSAATGNGFQAGYDEGATRIREGNAQFKEDHPILGVAAEIAGGLPVAALPFGAASAGTSRLRQAATGVAAGGVTGGVYGFNTGEDFLPRLGNAARMGIITGGIGGVAPTVARAVAPALAWAGKLLPTGANKAVRQMGPLVEGMSQDALDAMTRNPRLSIADVDANAQQLVQGIAVQPGQGRAIASRTVDMRRQSATDAVEGAFDQALGATPDVRVLLDDLKATARQNAQQGFGQALQNAQPVDVTPVIAQIDQMVPPAVQAARNTWGPVEQRLMRLRAELTDGRSMQVDPRSLHRLQSRVRAEAEELSKSPGESALVAARLRAVRQSLIDQIDQSAGGAYRPAQRQFADDMAVQDAFEKGVDVFRNRGGSAGLDDRPEFLQAWMNEASVAEQEALRQGVRVAADHVINAARNASRSGATLTDVGFNLDKLRIVLGDQEANRLAALLNDETRMMATNNAIMGNSQTAARQQGADATRVTSLASPGPAGLGGMAGLSAAMGGDPLVTGGLGAMAALGLGRRAMSRSSDMSRNAMMAEALLAQGRQRDGIVSSMQSGPARRAMARANAERTAMALLDTGNRAATPSMLNRWQTARRF